MEVCITDDFDLRKIAFSGQCFRVACFPNDVFRFITGSKVIYIKQISAEKYDISCSPNDWATVWSPYFDLSRNYSAIANSIPCTDCFMTKAYECGKGIRICRQDSWETLISFIISQRKYIPAIKKSIEQICDEYGDSFTTPYETIKTFPPPQRILQDSAEKLKSCQLGYRLPFVIDAANKVCSDKIDLVNLSSSSDEDLLNSLKQIKGVGDKVSACVALFAYGRHNLAPVDIWIQRIIDAQYGGVNPFPKYGEWAGIMQQFTFFYAQYHKKQEVKHGNA